MQDKVEAFLGTSWKTNTVACSGVRAPYKNTSLSLTPSRAQARIRAFTPIRSGSPHQGLIIPDFQMRGGRCGGEVPCPRSLSWHGWPGDPASPVGRWHGGGSLSQRESFRGREHLLSFA